MTEATTAPKPDDEITSLLKRCDTEDPAPEDVQALRRHLQESPHAWRVYGDLANAITEEMIRGIQTSALGKESVVVWRLKTRNELGYKEAPPLEKMLIDHLMLCWLRLQMAEHVYTGCTKEGGTLNQGLFWEKRLSAVQRRYLRAVETLARIRKLALPVLQVNIGDKQVNVAGG
jgi:hypothetical protein